MKVYTVLLLIMFGLASFQVEGISTAAFIKYANFLGRGMGADYQKKTFSDFASVTVSFLRELVNGGFFKTHENNNDKILRKISTTLKEIYEQQKKMQGDLKKLSEKVSLIVPDLITSLDESKIKSCKDSYRYFLLNPDSTIYIEQMKKCDTIYENVRSIGRTLKKKYIFSKVSNELGYCNGQAVFNSIQNLFYLFFEGYSILVASHQLQGKNESQVLIDEYEDGVKNIGLAIDKNIVSCANKFCDGGVQKLYKKSLEDENEQKILDRLHKAFPWYRFCIIDIKLGTEWSFKDIAAEVGVFEGVNKVLLFVRYNDTQNHSILEMLNSSDFNSDLNNKKTYCEVFKIQIKSQTQFNSTAGYTVSYTGKEDGNYIYSFELLVNKCARQTRRKFSCTKNSISCAPALKVNIWETVIRGTFFVIVFHWLFRFEF